MGRIFMEVDAKIREENIIVSLDYAKDEKLGLCIGSDWCSEKAHEELQRRVEEYGDARVTLDVGEARELAEAIMRWVDEQEAKK